MRIPQLIGCIVLTLCLGFFGMPELLRCFGNCDGKCRERQTFRSCGSGSCWKYQHPDCLFCVDPGSWECYIRPDDTPDTDCVEDKMTQQFSTAAPGCAENCDCKVLVTSEATGGNPGKFEDIERKRMFCLKKTKTGQ